MKTNLENKKVTSGFTTPDNYFEELPATILSKWNGAYNSSIIPSKTGFSVPENYFSENEGKLMDLIPHKNSKVISIKPKLYWVTSMAAVLLITIMLPFFYNSTEITKTELATQDYLEVHKDELSDYEVGVLLDNEDLESLENELIYNNLK